MRSRRELLTTTMAAAIPVAAPSQGQRQVKTVSKRDLPAPFAGMEATTVEVTYPPGVSSAAHRHGGFVLGYVLEGEYSFAIDDQPARVLHAGETFYEPPGAKHSTSANAHKSKTARILAVIIAEKGKELTTPA